MTSRKSQSAWEMESHEPGRSPDRLTVGCVAGYPLRPNMIMELYNLGRMVGAEVNLHLIMGPENLPARLRGLYHVHRVEAPRFHLAGLGYAIRAVCSYLRSHRPHLLLNIAQPFPLGGPMIIIAKWFKVPTLLRVTGDFLAEMDKYKHPVTRWRRKFVHGIVLSAIYRRAERVAPLGPRLGRKLIAHGFDSDRVVPLPQPFRAEQFRSVSASEKRQLRSAIGLASQKKVILFVGRLTWGKGADRILEIVRQIGRKSRRFQFCLVGDFRGDYGEVLSEWDNELVKLVGRVPTDEVQQYFQAADLLIHPSRNEGGPYVVLEALACGLPVLASPVGEIPELIRITATRPQEYVDYILEQEWTACQLPQQYDWNYQRKEYLAVFKSLSGEINSNAGRTQSMKSAEQNA